MQVNLDFAKTAAHQMGEVVEVLRAIFFAREKPAVTRWPALAIAKASQRWVLFAPGAYAGIANCFAGFAPQRFVVIAQRKQYMAWTRDSAPRHQRTAREMSKIVAKPGMKVFASQGGKHGIIVRGTPQPRGGLLGNCAT